MRATPGPDRPLAGPLAPAAGWAARVARGAPLPAEVVHHAKRTIVDWFAAVVPGGVMDPARILREALVDGHTTGPAALLPDGQRVPSRTAALVNGTAAHTAEVDDIFREGIYHPGAPTIAAALAAGQQLDSSGADLLRAVVVGFEIGTRVAATIQPAHYRFWHTTGTVGTLGAAAAVATLLRLDPAGFAHAVATSATMAAGLQQAFRSDAMSKPLHAGHAAEAGSLAALAAGRGFTGALDMLDGDAGLGAAMSDRPSWDGIFDDLGETFHIAAMTVKNHACCGHTFAAVDAVLQARETVPVDPDRVRAVRVATYRTALEVAGNPAPATAFEAQFSIQYCVAAALRLGSVRLAAFADDQLADPALRSLLGRVTLAVDPELDRAFPGRRGARVRLTLDDGSEHEVFSPTRRGDPDLPLTDAELTDKYTELVVPQLGPALAARLLDVLWELDKVDQVRSLPGGSVR
ncbi:MAG: MmgE/PrpD family protein [Micromonosporaceae bacterium]|nr:MmgE/PrpD family protein [Micromonosporaceae bacterium]